MKRPKQTKQIDKIGCSFSNIGFNGSKNHFGTIVYVSNKAACQNHLKDLIELNSKSKETDQNSFHSSLVSFYTNIKHRLCDCTKAMCQKSHNITELTDNLTDPVELLAIKNGYNAIRPKVVCPECGVNSGTSVYSVYNNNPEKARWYATCHNCCKELSIDEYGKASACDLGENETTEIIDLVSEDSEDIQDKPLAKCPTCQDPIAYDYVYKLKGEWEAWCDKCQVNFNISTGKAYIPEKTGKTETDDMKKDKSKKKCHAMKLVDKQLYRCNNCKYTTLFLSDVNKHENVELGLDIHYCLKEGDRYKCIFCGKLVDTWKEVTDHETVEGKKAYNGVSTGYSNTNYTHCVHKPRMVITAKERGWNISAGRLFDCTPEFNNFDILVNLTGSNISRRHDIPFVEMKKWEQGAKKYEVMNLDWPDRGVVDLPAEFWKDFIKNLLDKRGAQRLENKESPIEVVVFCIGGHGRTGTAIACLLVTALNWNAEKAISWVRTNVCGECIETWKQEDYVYLVAGETPPPPPKNSNKTSEITSTSLW